MHRRNRQHFAETKYFYDMMFWIQIIIIILMFMMCIRWLLQKQVIFIHRIFS